VRRLLRVRLVREPHETMAFVLLRNPVARLRGLLGTGPDARPVALARCSSIHTLGMGYRIDVAFVRADGLVLEAWRSVPPGRLLSHGGARIVLERPHGRGPWLARGDWIEMTIEEEAKDAELTEGGCADGWHQVRVCGNAGA
jgi:hypothetical protein